MIPSHRNYKGSVFSEQRLRIHFDRREDIVIIRLDGEMDIYSTRNLKTKFDRILKAGVTRFVLDLKNVKYVDSTALGLLLGFTLDVRQREGCVRCLAPEHQEVVKVFDRVRMKDVIMFADTLEAAIEEANAPAESPPDASQAEKQSPTAPEKKGEEQPEPESESPSPQENPEEKKE